MTIREKFKILNGDANNLHDYYQKWSTHQKAFIAVANSVIGVYIQKAIEGIGFGVSLGVCTSYEETFIDRISNVYKEIATSGCKSNKVELEFEYKQSGSNDGLYWLTGVEFL